MKRITIMLLVFIVTIFTCTNAFSQLKYQGGRVIIGTNDPYSSYIITVAGNGVYFNHTNGRFFQLDVSNTSAPRVAGNNNQVVFYNTATSTFNSIQVSNVYNLSDAKFKTGIQDFNYGLTVVRKLRPVSYNFIGNESRKVGYNPYTGSNAEIGLLAQDLEAVLPNLVFTDEKGQKLINYTALIPVLIDAVQSLQDEVESLKAGR
jgi:hypothetical protein